MSRCRGRPCVVVSWRTMRACLYHHWHWHWQRCLRIWCSDCNVCMQRYFHLHPPKTVATLHLHEGIFQYLPEILLLPTPLPSPLRWRGIPPPSIPMKGICQIEMKTCYCSGYVLYALCYYGGEVNRPEEYNAYMFEYMVAYKPTIQFFCINL